MSIEDAYLAVYGSGSASIAISIESDGLDKVLVAMLEHLEARLVVILRHV